MGGNPRSGAPVASKERPRTPCGGQTLDFDSLKKVVDLVRAIVCKLDSKGNILWMNRYGLEFFGFREEELLGRSVYETIVPLRESTGRDLSGLFMKILKSDGEVAPSINENLRKDGSRVWVYWSNVVLTDGGEKTVLSTGIDITERVRFELDLKRIHERERALIRILSLLMSSTAGIEEVSAAVLEEAKRLTGSEYGFVGTIDPESKEFVGHTLKSLLSGESRAPYYPTGSAAEPTPGVTEPLFPEEARAPEPAPGCRLKGTFRFPPDPDGKYRSLFGHALNTGEAFFTNSPRSHPASNGTPPGHVQINRFLAVPVLGLPSRAVLGLIALANPRTDASGQQIKVGAQSERSEAMTEGSRPLRDYTEEDLKAVSFLAHYFSLALQRKALEEKVSSSETYYRELFENSPIPILQIGGDGIITKVNSAFELLFGYQKPEVEGKLIWKRLVHPSELPRLEEYRKARLSGLEAPIKYEVKLLTKSGEVLECQA
ncbi:MAG: PAS domain S-box protein, partial [Candidatus Verstraetearchaeota archaeon]|nr:PAS domain S-box protein [Candidatus Verstraetearchaeota archaeon]